MTEKKKNTCMYAWKTVKRKMEKSNVCVKNRLHKYLYAYLHDSEPATGGFTC